MPKKMKSKTLLYPVSKVVSLFKKFLWYKRVEKTFANHYFFISFIFENCCTVNHLVFFSLTKEFPWSFLILHFIHVQYIGHIVLPNWMFDVQYAKMSKHLDDRYYWKVNGILWKKGMIPDMRNHRNRNGTFTKLMTDTCGTLLTFLLVRGDYICTPCSER